MRWLYIILALCAFGYVYNQTELLRPLRENVDSRLKQISPKKAEEDHGKQYISVFQDCVRKRRDMARLRNSAAPNSRESQHYARAEIKLGLLCDGIQSQCLRNYDAATCPTIVDSYREATSGGQKK